MRAAPRFSPESRTTSVESGDAASGRPAWRQENSVAGMNFVGHPADRRTRADRSEPERAGNRAGVAAEPAEEVADSSAGKGADDRSETSRTVRAAIAAEDDVIFPVE